MADDRLTGWRKSEVEDFYDLIDEKLVREDELSADYVDRLAEDSVSVADLAGDTKSWRFGHVIVDEAQELSPMQWRMIKRRSKGGAVTIVGDLAQKSAGVANSWSHLLGNDFGDYKYCELSVNYRSPVEVNEIASQILNQIDPNLPASNAIRSSNIPVEYEKTESASDLVNICQRSLGMLEESERLAIIFCDEVPDLGEVGQDVAMLSVTQAKGLEFDSVIVADVDKYVAAGKLSDLYVAVTRSTRRLLLTHANPLPEYLVPKQ